MTMKTFDFRLAKVLDYRRLVEEWAKDAYLDARSARLEAEVVMLGIRQQRHALFLETATTIEDLQTQELLFNAIDERESTQQIVVNVLLNEEGLALGEWTSKRRDVAVLEKLHDKAFEEWSKEMSREEQAFLDEWTSGRRAA